MADPLIRLRRATTRRSRSDADWREAIQVAHEEGISLRKIATAAGVSHVRVFQILRAE